MLQGEHSAILFTFIKLPVVIKTFVLSIFEWPFYTGFTVSSRSKQHIHADTIYTYISKCMTASYSCTGEMVKQLRG